MNRRALLATVGSLSTVGCLGAVEPPRAAPVDRPNGCPRFGEDVRRVYCTDSAVPADAPVVLDRSADRADLPTATLSFTLRNVSSRRFTMNPWEWHVHKYVEGTWFHVAPRSWNVPAMELAPGDAHTWTLAVDNTRLDGSPLPVPRGTREIEIAGLGGGHYAFSTDGWFEDDDHDHQTGVAALFELDGPSIDLRPTDEVTAVERDGAFVTVRADREDRDKSRVAAFELARTDDPDGTVRAFVVEKAMHDRRLRNTLPYFEPGVERVRLVEPDGTYPPFGVHEPTAIEFEGETYQVTAEVVEED